MWISRLERHRGRPEWRWRDRKSEKCKRNLKKIKPFRNSKNSIRQISRTPCKACSSFAQKFCEIPLPRKTTLRNHAKISAHSKNISKISDRSSRESNSANNDSTSCFDKNFYKNQSSKRTVAKEIKNYHSRSAECCGSKRRKRLPNRFRHLHRV